jgi:hypothetical protein
VSNNGNLRWNGSSERGSPRVYSLRKITISYEGENECIVVKPPNVSAKGMFINTNRAFPEGAVLNVRFELALTNAEIQTRCEVRFCQPGIGVGVEFIGLAADSKRLIEYEIELSSCHSKSRRAKVAAARSPLGSRGKRTR